MSSKKNSVSDLDAALLQIDLHLIHEVAEAVLHAVSAKAEAFQKFTDKSGKKRKVITRALKVERKAVLDAVSCELGVPAEVIRPVLEWVEEYSKD